MKLIRARPSRDRNLSSGCPAKFRCVGGSLDTELLESINGDQAVCPAENTKRPKRSSDSIARWDVCIHPDVGADAVHRPVVGSSALPINTELPSIRLCACRKNDARCELN